MDWPPQYDKFFRSLDQDKLRFSNGTWYARCAAHDDRTPSLSVKVGDNGCLVVKCHRNNGNGCSFGDILAAMGCTTNDVFPEDWRRKAVAPRQEAIYDYRTEDGKLSFQSVRYKGDDGKKRYLQRRPNPDLSSKEPWINDIKGIGRVLFLLPGLVAHIEHHRRVGGTPKVYVVEGEPSVLALRSIGLVATTNSGGCGKFALTDYTPLAMCDVVVIPDNDSRDGRIFLEQGRESWAGQSHAEEVCRLLYPMAASVKYLDLPASPEKGDAADWVDCRRGWMGAADMRDELAAVEASAPCWVPPAQPHPLFATAESLSRSKGFTSVNAWKRGVEDLAGELVMTRDGPSSRAAAEELVAAVLSGCESFLGVRRPKRSLPV